MIVTKKNKFSLLLAKIKITPFWPLGITMEIYLLNWGTTEYSSVLSGSTTKRLIVQENIYVHHWMRVPCVFNTIIDVWNAK